MTFCKNEIHENKKPKNIFQCSCLSRTYLHDIFDFLSLYLVENNTFSRSLHVVVLSWFFANIGFKMTWNWPCHLYSLLSTMIYENDLECYSSLI